MTELCTEPTVDDLLADLGICLLMASDGVQEVHIRELLKKVSEARGVTRFSAEPHSFASYHDVALAEHPSA